MDERRVRANGVVLQIQEYPAGGDPIIFLHFSGANLMMWQRAVPSFRDRHRLILIDLRGHGKSDRPEGGYHLDDMAADVAAVAEQLGVGAAHLVGSSMGAEVGLSLAANYPDEVLSLVCEGPPRSEFGPYGAWEGSEADFEAYVAGQLEQVRNRPETGFPSLDGLVEDRRAVLEPYGWWNASVEAMVRYGARRTDEGTYTRGLGKHAMAEYLDDYFHCRCEEYYARVRCPLLVLVGEDELEDEREREAVEGLLALAERGEVVEMSGWVHPYGWLLDPERASRAILAFLEATEG